MQLRTFSCLDIFFLYQSWQSGVTWQVKAPQEEIRKYLCFFTNPQWTNFITTSRQTWCNTTLASSFVKVLQKENHCDEPPSHIFVIIRRVVLSWLTLLLLTDQNSVGFLVKTWTTHFSMVPNSHLGSLLKGILIPWNLAIFSATSAEMLESLNSQVSSLRLCQKHTKHRQHPELQYSSDYTTKKWHVS